MAAIPLERAYAHCEAVARGHYENFPVASLAVPRALRPHVCAVYAFARAADDFADERAFDPGRSLDDFMAGWTPSSVALARARELQILLAALNADWPELLPERLRGVGKDEIQARIDALRGRFA